MARQEGSVHSIHVPHRLSSLDAGNQGRHSFMKPPTFKRATLLVAILSVLAVTAAPAARGDTVTRFAYDTGGNVVSVTDPRGLVTSYTYDGLGQKWQQNSPDTGSTTYSYDGYGRLSSLTRAGGNQVSYVYDGIGRRLSASAGGATQSFTYDNCANGTGRLCRVADGGGVVTYNYSPEGWVTARGFAMGSTNYALGYSYNALGQVTSIAYPDGNQALYSYINGTVSSVGAKINGVVYTVVGGVGYQPGNRGMATWISSNGLTNSYGYDTEGKLTRIDVAGIQSLSFNYDDANRIVRIANGTDDGMTQSFGYDDMSRLVSVYSGLDIQAISYDANGNRTYHALNGAGITVNPKSNNNQINGLSGSTNVNYGYDPRGNLTSISGVGTFTYDAFNRLSAAPNASYYVGPEGQRLRKTVGGANTWFAPDASGALMAEATNGWTDYVWLNGRLIGRISGGQFLNIHTDHVGRPEAMTDGNRNVVWRARNFAFDRQVTINHAVPLNLGFPGQYYDAETGLWNNGFRDYSPSLGRYIQSDPIGLAGGINTYAYVGGNPLSGIDPLGLNTYTIGVNGALVFLGGGQGALGIYFNPGKGCGEEFDFGLYSSKAVAAGTNVGAGVVGGVLYGPASSLAGQTYDANSSVGPVQGSFSVAPDGTKSWTAGWSAVGLPGGGSFSTTTTQTFGVSDIKSMVWQALNRAAAIGAAQQPQP